MVKIMLTLFLIINYFILKIAQPCSFVFIVNVLTQVTLGFGRWGEHSRFSDLSDFTTITSPRFWKHLHDSQVNGMEERCFMDKLKSVGYVYCCAGEDETFSCQNVDKNKDCFVDFSKESGRSSCCKITKSVYDCKTYGQNACYYANYTKMGQVGCCKSEEGEAQYKCMSLGHGKICFLDYSDETKLSYCCVTNRESEFSCTTSKRTGNFSKSFTLGDRRCFETNFRAIGQADCCSSAPWAPFTCYKSHPRCFMEHSSDTKLVRCCRNHDKSFSCLPTSKNIVKQVKGNCFRTTFSRTGDSECCKDDNGGKLLFCSQVSRDIDGSCFYDAWYYGLAECCPDKVTSEHFVCTLPLATTACLDYYFPSKGLYKCCRSKNRYFKCVPEESKVW